MPGIFDYIFLRAYTFFAEKGQTIPDTKGAAFLSLIQFFTLLDIFAAMKLIFNFPYPHKLLLSLPVVLLVIINSCHYEKVDIQNIKQKWNEEQWIRVRNGWIITVYLIVIILIPPIIGTISN